jgi:uncharacterized protein (TIGR03435 family)
LTRRASVATGLLATLIVVEAFDTALRSQSTPNASKVAFEVASVKVTPGGTFAISPYGQGRFSIRNVSLTLLIAFAYGASDDQVSGGPDWRTSEYYDINAKAEDGVVLSNDELRPRLQDLLSQRFKLAIHRETTRVPGYALQVAKDGAKLKVSDGKAVAFPAILPGGVRAPGVSMDTFATTLARQLGRPVVNETRLNGTYAITLDYAPDTATDSSLPSIFTAVQEQLGLRLESRLVPAETLVIDHVEHPTPD